MSRVKSTLEILKRGLELSVEILDISLRNPDLKWMSRGDPCLNIGIVTCAGGVNSKLYVYRDWISKGQAQFLLDRHMRTAAEDSRCCSLKKFQVDGLEFKFERSEPASAVITINTNTIGAFV